MNKKTILFFGVLFTINMFSLNVSAKTVIDGNKYVTYINYNHLDDKKIFDSYNNTKKLQEFIPLLTQDLFNINYNNLSKLTELPYSIILKKAKDNYIKEMLIISNSENNLSKIYIQTNDNQFYWSYLPNGNLDNTFTTSSAPLKITTKQILDDKNLEFVTPDKTFFGTSVLVLRLLGLASGPLIFVVLLLYLTRSLKGLNPKNDSSFQKIDKNSKEKVTFLDVAGQEEAKAELVEIVEFLKNPTSFSSVGAKVPKGVILEGSPGNGKTLLAKAVAGEASVNFFSIDGPSVQGIYAGFGSARIRSVFRTCRKNAPCILFIDEIDSIGNSRSNGSGGDIKREHEHILNTLLTELDGIGKKEKHNYGPIVVIAATNRADVLDQALVRSGRFDRKISISQPDLKGRESILRVHAKKVNIDPDLSWLEVAKMTTGFSGADIATFVNEAAIFATRLKLEHVTMLCFRKAHDKILLGLEKKDLHMSEEEKNIVIFHECGHTITALFSPNSDPVHKVTSIPHGQSLGVMVRIPEFDRKLVSKAKIEDDLVVALGGRAAESILLGEDFVTSGAAADIKQVTIMARNMVGSLGMSSEMGMINYLDNNLGYGPFGTSPETQAKLDTIVKNKVDFAYAKAIKILSDNWDLMMLLTKELREREVLTGNEIKELFEEYRKTNPLVIS
jgi:cell division protease FtsH